MSDAAMEMAARQLSDAQQLRRALAQLVEVCRVHYHGSQALEPALLLAEAALEDTSHEGWLRRMRERRQLALAERFAECRASERHLGSIYGASDHPPTCSHCERDITADGRLG